MGRRPKGDGSIIKHKEGYKGYITFNGKRIYKYGKNKIEVSEKLKTLETDLKNGIDINDKSTLGQWINNYITYFGINYKPSTIERYLSIYNNHVKNSIIDNIKLRDLTSPKLQAFINKIYKEGLPTSTIKSIFKLLRLCLNAPVSKSLIIINPCSEKRVTLPKCKSESEEVQILNIEDQKKFIKTSQNHRLGFLFLFALGTGMREGEILALKWSDIRNNTVTVSRSIKRVKNLEASGEESKTIILEQTTKTHNSNRKIPLPKKVAEELEIHKKRQRLEKIKAANKYEDNDYVFATEFGKPIDARNLTRIFHKLLEEAGVTNIKFHALRHTYATRLFELGETAKTVQKLLGHNDIQTTFNIYTHVLDVVKDEAVEKLNKIL